MKVFFLKYLRIRVFWLLLQLVSTLFMFDDSSCYLLWIVFAFLIIDESKHKKANLDLPCINSSCLATIRNGNAFAYILLNYTHIYIGKTLSIFYPNLIWAVRSKEWPIMKKKKTKLHPFTPLFRRQPGSSKGRLDLAAVGHFFFKVATKSGCHWLDLAIPRVWPLLVQLDFFFIFLVRRDLASAG